MDPKHLTELPLVFQIITGFGLFFGAFMLAVGGWFWKKISPKLPDALKPPEATTGDAVVLSAAIADSASIAKLAHVIERLCEHLEENNDDMDRAFARSLSRLGDISDGIERVHDVVARLDKTVRERSLL